MKDIMFTAVLVLTSIMQVHAGITAGNSNLEVVRNEKSIILNSASDINETKELTITDAFGRIVFSDVIESNKKRIKYDLSALTNASYTISLVASKVTNIYEAKIDDEKVEILNIKSYFRPAVDNVDGKVLVRAELENKEDIRISIYDKSNVLVFHQNIEKENSFVQSFNLSQLPKGEYNVLVSSEYFNEHIMVTL